MKKIFRFLILAFFSFVTPFFPMEKIFAFDYFIEEFDDNSIDTNKWDVQANGGLAIEDSGFLTLSAEYTSTFPFVRSKINPIPTSGDFDIDFKIQYTRVTTKGTGLVFATQFPINGSIDTSVSDPVFSNYFFIDIWQESVLGFFNVYTGNCYNIPCNLSDIFAYRETSSNLTSHLIRFSYQNQIYRIFIDGEQKFVSSPTIIRPTKLWLGNNTIQGPGDTWTSYKVDYIRITTNFPSPTPTLFPTLTPTPTPTLTPSPTPTLTPTLTPTVTPTLTLTPTPTVSILPPVVILPGLGASWNKAILTGGEAPQSEWKIPDFVKIYDGLTDTLVNAGYVKGQNLFTFAYDWRKPINQIADGLKDYLNTVVEPLNPGQKIDLVGHSLGGLVARGYGQKFGLDKIKQVVSLGSPHSGAIQPYSAWAGGEFTSDKLWQYLAFELLIQANKSGFQTDADVFRKQAPVIRDLLPTFNYLKKDSLGNPTVPLANMNPNNRNFWLEGLNGSLSTSFFDVFTAIIGDKGNTPEWYKVREQNWYEKILGLWQDGKPVTTEFAPGDLTVLTKSGKINPDPFKQVTNTDHTGLITTTSGIEKVLEVLGFPSSVPIVTYPEFNFAPGLIFQLLSPARLHITGPSGIFDSDSDNMVLIPNSMPGDYLVDVIGEGDGIYTLLVGQKSSNTTFWNKYMGRVIPGSTESYHFRFDNDNPSPYPLFDQTGMKYLKEARAKILTLPPNPTCGSTVDQINRIIDFIGKSKKAAAFSSCNSLLEKIFDCRKNYSGVSERNILFNAVMDLQEAYVILGNSLRQPDKKGTIAFHSAAKAKMKLANKGLKLLANLNQVSKMQAASFMKAEEVLEMAQAALNQNDYHRVFILSQISIFLTKEAVEK